MEEWDFVDEKELKRSFSSSVCVTCQHFRYGVDRHCHTVVGCNIRERLLRQGEHLTQQCRLWAPTWEKEFGWASEAG